MDQREREYLVPGRLQDVLTLIQILGAGTTPRRTARNICVTLQEVDDENCVPTDRVDHWANVARAHPEFFRVSGKSVSISLIARHVVAENEAGRILRPGAVRSLMETAIELHDKQVKRSQQWALYVPLWAAVIAFLASIITAMASLLMKR
jgi:hypothetical protein